LNILAEDKRKSTNSNQLLDNRENSRKIRDSMFHYRIPANFAYYAINTRAKLFNQHELKTEEI
jgi:hypothetical protein